MSNLHNLQLALIDTQDKLQRELQFTADSKALIAKAMATTREALAALEKEIMTAMDERMRALAMAIGSGAPSPETITVQQAVGSAVNAG